jgi:hypothetical protein
MNRISQILKQYINENIPKKATNIFWQMFNGIEAMFQHLEYRLDIYKRERNILRAQYLSSLRNLAAQNGIEPVMKFPAKGIVQLQLNTKVFNTHGYPLFLPPYSVFTNKNNKLNYYYNSDKSLRIDTNSLIIPVVEGEVKQVNHVSKGNHIERIYLADENIAQDSITIDVNGEFFQQVKSFFNNENVNDNKQFVVKYSVDAQNPIVIYIKGTKFQDNLNIIYRLTSGELGNIDGVDEFETNEILNANGVLIDINDSDILIQNIFGFDYGSNGTDENSLRAGIGYNHGTNLLFDVITYTNFIGKFSTIVLQKIEVVSKTINNLYIWKKQAINESVKNIPEFVIQYQNIVRNQEYLLSNSEQINLTKIISDNEFCLASHNIFDPEICKFAFQIIFPVSDKYRESVLTEKLNELIYLEFNKFLFYKKYVVNFELKFEEFMVKNDVKIEYTIFNQKIEEDKINKKLIKPTPYIIDNSKYLPILYGNFDICDSEMKTLKLFFDINIIFKKLIH